VLASVGDWAPGRGRDDGRSSAVRMDPVARPARPVGPVVRAGPAGARAVRVRHRAQRAAPPSAAGGAAAEGAALLREGRLHADGPQKSHPSSSTATAASAAAKESPAMQAASVVPSAGSIRRKEPVRRETA
jgi:hypothetical protein